MCTFDYECQDYNGDTFLHYEKMWIALLTPNYVLGRKDWTREPLCAADCHPYSRILGYLYLLPASRHVHHVFIVCVCLRERERERERERKRVCVYTCIFSKVQG